MAAIINTKDLLLQSASTRIVPIDLSLSYKINKNSGIDVTAINGTGTTLVKYTFAQGADINSNPIVTGTGSITIAALPPGVYTIWCMGEDVNGNKTNTASISVAIASSTVSAISATLEGPNIKLVWALSEVFTGDISVDYYEIRLGDTYSTAELIGRSNTTIYNTRATYSNGITKKWWIAAKSIAKSITTGDTYSTPISASLTINAPSIVTNARTEIVDNNVLIIWAASAVSSSQLPVDYYEVKKGDVYSTSVLVGSNGNSTFTSVFEQASGVFTYWIVPYDTAGVAGTIKNLSAAVSQPPDYVLRNNYNSSFTVGTYTNLFLELGSLVGPVNTTQTWTTHYLAGADGGVTPWTSPSAQIAAGYPIYIAPNVSTGTYEEIIDYGTSTVISTTGTVGSITGSGPWNSAITGMSSTTGLTVGSIIVVTAGSGTLYNGTTKYATVTSIISSTSITCITTGGTTPTAGTVTNITLSSYIPTTTVTTTLSNIAISGSVIIACVLSYKLVAADAYTVLSPTTSALIPNFRYLRVAYTLTPASTPGTNLVKITGLNIKLSVKLRSDSGVGYYDSTLTDLQNFKTFGYNFLSADTPIIQSSSSSTPLIPVVIYSGGANPTGFSVKLYDRFGATQSGPYSWTVRGY
jgi:hypothetical protein